MKKVWFILFGLLLLLPLSYSLKIVHTYDLNNLEFNGKYNFSYTPYGISYYDGKWYIITIIPPKIFEIDSNFTKVINKWNAPCDFPLGIRRYNGKWYIVGGNIGYWNPTRVYECDDNFNCNSVANIDSIEPDAYDIFHYNDRWYLIGNKRIVYEFYNNWTYTGKNWNIAAKTGIMGAPYGLFNLNGKWYVLREENSNNRIEIYDLNFSYLGTYKIMSSGYQSPHGFHYLNGYWYILDGNDKKVYQITLGNISITRTCCPHVSIECKYTKISPNVRNCTVTYTHDNETVGGITLRWNSSDVILINYSYPTCEKIEGFKYAGWDGAECYYIPNGAKISFLLYLNSTRTKAIPVYYRAWDNTDDFSCSGYKDYDRDPSNGTCSSSCNFDSNLNAWFECDSYKTTLPVCGPCNLTKCPDVNNDTEINVLDMVKVVKNFCTSNCTNEKLNYDLNNDSEVDINDICCIAYHFGKNASSIEKCNRPPHVSLISPQDNASVTSPVLLSVKPVDPDGDNLTVKFYVDGKYVDNCIFYVSSNETVTCSYNLGKGKFIDIKDFKWNVTVCDNYSCINSDTWYFSTSRNISSSVRIEKPGEYDIYQDISTDSAFGIDVLSDNVVIDGHGHSLSGGENSRYGIRVSMFTAGHPFKNITIKNLRLVGWRHGIYWAGVNDSKITNVIFDSNRRHGILMYKSSNNVLDGVTAINNRDIGVMLSSSGNNTIRNCISNQNGGNGFNIFLSDSNTIYNTTAENNGYTGIYFFESPFNNVKECKLNNNKNGIFFYSSNSTTIENSWITGNNFSGIELHYSWFNKIYNNVFNNTENYFIMDPYVNYWNETVGNYWGKPDGTGFSDTCTDADGDGICDSSYQLFENNIDYLPRASIS